jgi:uncharacterized repeat protein (TIGR01451 family)
MLKQIVLGTVFMAFGFGAAAANEGPLKSELEAFVITVDESGEEVRTEGEGVNPGDIVEYTLSYENTSEMPLAGLVISAPVPVATEFVAASNVTVQTAAFEVSIDDGATWAAPPLMVKTEAGETEIDASEYDLVRWLPSDAISGGEVWDFTYRVTVE